MNENEPPPPPPPVDSEAAPSLTPPPLAGGDFLSNLTSNQWAMALHLSQLAKFIVPGLGIAGPIIIWQRKKAQFPDLDRHGKMVTNWMISLLIYSIVALAITCGIGMILLLPLGIVGSVFAVMGGIKANNGVFWKYPLTISFLK